MAGTERDSPTGDEAGVFDDNGGEPDTIDRLDVDDADQAAYAGDADVEDDGGDGGLLSWFRRESSDAEADVEEGEEDAPSFAERFVDDARELREALSDFRGDDDDSEPTRAQLVDGANVMFIDPAAKSKSLYEFDLALITAPQYPEPAILKNDVPIEIPAGSVLCSATSATMLDYGGTRVIARAFILVPPERADEVAPEHREELPEELQGKTVPQRDVQDEDFYQLMLNSAASTTE